MKKLVISKDCRGFETADGKPFFYFGDTAWELFNRLDNDELELYLQNRRQKGFTVIQAAILSDRDNCDIPNRFGDTCLGGDRRDPLVWNENYWRHVDYVVNRANELGFIVAMVPSWGDKWNLKWGYGPEIFTPENGYEYCRRVAERYAEKDVIWVLGGDRPIECDRHFAIVEAMGRGLRDGDGGSHLITYHPSGCKSSSEWFHACDWLDFNMLQSGHCRCPRALDMVSHDWAMFPVKPVVDGEPSYEVHPNNFQSGYDGWLDEWDVRREFYYTVCAGGAGYTYGAHAMWQFWNPQHYEAVNYPRITWKQALDLPGVFQLGLGMKLLESLDAFRRQPAADYVRKAEGYRNDTAFPAAACRGVDGSWALLYLPHSQHVDVNPEIVSSSSVTIQFLNPRNMQVLQELQCDHWDGSLVPPPAFDGGNDCLVLVK